MKYYNKHEYDINYQDDDHDRVVDRMFRSLRTNRKASLPVAPVVTSQSKELDISPLELKAIELMRAAKRAADQATTDRARAIHEKALLQDSTVTILGQLGTEALGLYTDFDQREKYFMRGTDRRNSLLKKRSMKTYVSHLMVAEGHSHHDALKIAERQHLLFNRLKNSNKVFYKPNGSKVAIRTKIDLGRVYQTPTFNEVEAEFLDTNALVGQTWQAKIKAPFKTGLTVNLYNNLHESTHGLDKTLHSYALHLPKEDLSIVRCTTGEGEPITRDEDLLHPLGVLIAAREAVRTTVPERIYRKW